MAETLVKKNANLNDTINLIVTVVNQCYNSAFVKQLTSTLDPQGDKVEFIHRLFDYVCRNVRYQLDPEGRERVLKPETTIANKEGDCKKMTVLIASVLKCAGIEPLIKHVFYKAESYTHVYVIVPYPDCNSYIIVDPVNDQKWNSEVIYERANVYDLKGNKMDLFTGKANNDTRLNVIPNFKSNVNMAASSVEHDMVSIMGCNVMGAADRNAIIDEIFSAAEISGVGKLKDKIKEKIDKIKEKVKTVVSTVGFAPGRIAFLGIVKLNPFKIANKIAKAATINRPEIERAWMKFGGKPDELFKVVIGASGRTSGIGFAVDAALLAAAAPILIAMIPLVKKITGQPDTELDGMLEKTADSTTNTTIPNIVVHSVDAVKRNDVDKDDSGSDDGTKPTIGGFSLPGCLTGSKIEVGTNLFKFCFFYFPMGAAVCQQHPVIFISVCVIGIADMIGVLPKFLRSPKNS